MGDCGQGIVSGDGFHATNSIDAAAEERVLQAARQQLLSAQHLGRLYGAPQTLPRTYMHAPPSCASLKAHPKLHRLHIQSHEYVDHFDLF